MTSATVGFLGLGKIGSPMAANVAAAGFDLVCFDIAGTVGRLPAGAVAAGSVAEVAGRADTILMSLPDGSATVGVAEEIAAVAPQRRRVATVIDLSTTGPLAAQAAAALLARVGIVFCDGPVSGGVAGARARTISCMFAGPASAFETQRPLLDSFAGNVFHVGTEPGQGQMMKLVNNFLSATALAATSEAFAAGAAAGLDLAAMVEVVNVSSGRNTATSDKFPNRVLTGRYDAGFSTAHMTKDVGLFVDAVAQLGTADAVIAAVASQWRGALAALPASDFTEIWTYVNGSAER